MASYDWTKKIQAVPSIGGSVSTTDNRSAWTTPTRTDVSASLPDLPLLKSAYTEEEEEKKVVKSPYVSQTKQEIEKKYGFTPAPEQRTEQGWLARFLGMSRAEENVWSRKDWSQAAIAAEAKPKTTTLDILGESTKTGIAQAVSGVQTVVNEIPRFIATGVNYVAKAFGADKDVMAQQSFTEALGTVVGSKKVTQGLELATGITLGRQQQQRMGEVLSEANTGERILSSVVSNAVSMGLSSGIGSVASAATKTATAGKMLSDITSAQRVLSRTDMPTVMRSLGMLGTNLSSLQEGATGKEVTYQWTSGLTEATTELMFGIFDEAPALFKLGNKAFPTASNMIFTYLKGAAGESFEEAMQYIAQTGIDYLYYNEGRTFSEMFDWKQLGENALAGGIGSMVFTTYGAIRSGAKASTIDRNLYDVFAREALNKPLSEVTVDDMNYLAQIASDAVHNNEVNIELSSAKFEAAKNGEVWNPQGVDEAEYFAEIQRRKNSTENKARFGEGDATVTDVTSSSTMPLEAPTSVSAIQQASYTTTAVETPTSASIGVEMPSAQERVAQATKKPIADTITEIVDASASVEEARQKYSAMLDADESIVDEYANEIKTPEDLDIRIAELAKQVEASTDNPQGKAWDGKVNLQLLGLQRFAKRVLKVPEGSRAYSFMDNIIRYMNKTHDQRKMMRLENRIQTEDMFYERLHGKDVVADARAILNNPSKKIRGKNLQDMYDKLTLTKIDEAGKILTYELEPFEMVALSMYASELAANPDPNNIEADMLKADLIIRKISDRMTTAGQFTQAARYVYEQIYPEIRAKRIIDEFDRANKPIERADLDKRSTETERIINANRKEAILDGFANLFRYAEIPAEQLKQRIEADLNPKTEKQRNDITEMVNTLFRIYKETNPGQRAVTDPYAAIATMAQNRARYGQVWNRAKELLLARGAYEPALIAYVDRLADPTMTRSAMDRAISATMQSMNVSPYDLAKRFFVTGGESIVEFTNMLRQNLPDMDEDSFKYLSDALSKRFAERMEERRTRMIEQLSKQYDASGSKILQRKKKEIKQQTIDQLIDVAFKKSLDIEAIRRTWANRMGLASISEDMKNKIYDTMKKIARMTDDEQRENAYFDLVKEISAQMPGDSYDKFLAWRRFAMLMSPVSWIKNGVSNIVSMPFYFMSDQLENAFNKMAGNEIPADKRIAGKRWIRKGDVLLESAVAHYASPERIKRMVESSAKYSIGKLIAQEKRIFGNSTIEKITKVPYHVMSEGKFTEDSDASVLTRWLGDTYMFERHFKAAFRNRLIAIGYTTETDTDARIALAKRAADDAYEVAIIRTYRKVNTLAAKLNSLKSSREVQARVQRELDKGNIDAARSIQRSATALNGLIDIMVPFVVTPVAIVEQGVKFSPLALAYQTARLVGYEVNSKILHKEIPAMQLSNIHKGLAQALSGTIGQFGVGLLLGLLGFLTGAPPENEKEKKEWAQKGKKAYSLYIPGWGSLSLDWMQPVSMTLMMGAQFANTWLDSDKDLAGFGESSVASLEALFTNSIIKTIQTQFGGSYDTTLAGSAKDIAIDAAMQGLPGIVRRFNRFIDPYERDIYNGSTINVLANRVLSHVPFASFAIAPKVDIWGNEVRQTRDTGVVGTVERFALNMLSPFIYQGADKDPLTVEVSRLFNTTSDSDAIPIVPSRDFAKEYDLVGNDWANFQKIFGNLQHEYATIVMESERYKKADDATRVKYIRKAYTEASKDAKEQYIEQYIDTKPKQ